MSRLSTQDGDRVADAVENQEVVVSLVDSTGDEFGDEAEDYENEEEDYGDEEEAYEDEEEDYGDDAEDWS